MHLKDVNLMAKPKINGKFNPCPKCGKLMQNRSHTNVELILGKAYRDHYFSNWDYCKPCKHVQHYSSEKRYTGNINWA